MGESMGLGFTNLVGTGGCGTCVWVVVDGGVAWVRVSDGGWCYVCVYCESGFFVYLYIVIDRYLRILGAPSVQ